MKLEEVLPIARSTGKSFRQGNRSFFRPQDGNGKWAMGVCYESLLADDWELESQSITITEEQFDAAWEKLMGRGVFSDRRPALKKELGFK